MEKYKVVQNIILNMFSGLEFCVEFISEVRNAKSAIVFLNININVESCASDGSQNMRPTSSDSI